ncbi:MULTISPECIES: anti-sigma factor [unclassified Nocardioides]|uniref:anti-sigma factor n=1 Tax=unclassified Nocardioides TaxID=2615069 RepID=UPI002664F404|nr:anti-sigma factor [Nocardioides sp. Arc9.136]WKN48364.1 anti-sigma factor [Nocardioides sp. Arc9.136]
MSDDIHALSGAYAVDALDDIERAQFERHLAGCDTCREEVDSLREASALLAETTMLEPSADLRARVLAQVSTVRPLPPLVPAHAPAPSTGSVPADPARPRRRRLTGLVAAAAAVVAIGAGTGVLVEQPWEDDTSQAPLPSAVDRIKAAPDVQTFEHEFPDGAEAVLYRSASLNEAVIVTHDMGPAPDGKVYQAWLQHDDVMVSAGLMPEGPDNTVPLEGDPATANGFGITVEPAGGSVVPSKQPVLLVDFGSA